MIKTKISAVAAALVLVAGSAVADTQVVGQVSAAPSAVIEAGSVKTNIGMTAVPYIQGDVVTTYSDSSATLRLMSGKASFVAAPNTSVQVVNGEAGEIALNQGAIEVSAAAGFPVSVTTVAGTFEVSANGAFDAIVLAKGDQLAVVSKSGELFVSSQGVVSKVTSDQAFSYNGEAEVVEVAFLAPFIATLGLAGTIAAVVAGVIVIDEVANDDDDDDASPN